MAMVRFIPGFGKKKTKPVIYNWKRNPSRNLSGFILSRSQPKSLETGSVQLFPDPVVNLLNQRTYLKLTETDIEG